MVDVSIITVSTNEKHYVLNCLKSIYASRTGYSYEVIVLDNASSDGTSEAIKNDYSKVRLVRFEKVRGYIESNNYLMNMATGRYILLLNSDIDLREDTLEHMTAFMDNRPRCAISTCRLNFDDGGLQLTCRRFPTPMTYIARLPHFFRWIKWAKAYANNIFVRRYLMMDYDHKTTREVDWFLSAFFLMRREAINDIGMLDEKLVEPFYLEDVDWCFRAHLKGWQVFYVPETSALHHYQRSSVKRFGKLSVVHMLNILIFFKKHWWSMLLGRHRRPKR